LIDLTCFETRLNQFLSGRPMDKSLSLIIAPPNDRTTTEYRRL